MASIVSAGTTSSTALNMSADTSGVLQLASNNGTVALTVTTGQNVGIGTSSPTAKFQVVANNDGIATTAGSGTQAQVQIAGNNTTLGSTSFDLLQGASSEAYVYNRANNSLIFGTNNTERMRIDASGNLLVGGTSGSAISKDSNISSIYTTAKNGLLVRQTGSSASSYAVVFENSNGTIGTIVTNGSTTTYNTSSDYRLKENVQPMVGALATVAQLKPVTYTWKEDGSKGQGFIAHELQKIVPDCVTGIKDDIDIDGNPKYQGVDTSFLVATLTKAIQEQQALITTLQTQVSALQAKVGV
jgi:Chaperone of endosialidase